MTQILSIVALADNRGIETGDSSWKQRDSV
jgi:hypothetical protein